MVVDWDRVVAAITLQRFFLEAVIQRSNSFIKITLYIQPYSIVFLHL